MDNAGWQGGAARVDVEVVLFEAAVDVITVRGVATSVADPAHGRGRGLVEEAELRRLAVAVAKERMHPPECPLRLGGRNACGGPRNGPRRRNSICT